MLKDIFNYCKCMYSGGGGGGVGEMQHHILSHQEIV